MRKIRSYLNSFWIPSAAGVIVLVVGGTIATMAPDSRVILAVAGVAITVLGACTLVAICRSTPLEAPGIPSNAVQRDCNISDRAPQTTATQPSTGTVTPTIGDVTPTIGRQDATLARWRDPILAPRRNGHEPELVPIDLASVTRKSRHEDTIEVPFSTAVGLRPERPTASIRFA